MIQSHKHVPKLPHPMRIEDKTATLQEVQTVLLSAKAMPRFELPPVFLHFVGIYGQTMPTS